MSTGERIGYIPTIEQKDMLTKPIVADAYIDQTAQFDFPFALNELPRILASSEADTDSTNLATRTITEGRAYSYNPVAFKKKDSDTVYLDLTIKGGGSEIKPNVRLFENTSPDQSAIQYDTEKPIPDRIEVDGESMKVRYHTAPIVTLTSMLGVHSTEAGMSDKFMSEKLEKEGLRTRTLVAAWELPDETEMVTPNGKISPKVFFEKTGVKPGLEMWAVRCKYRVQDILRYVFETENPNPEPSKYSGMLLHPTRVDGRKTETNLPSHKYSEEKFSKEQQEGLLNNFTLLANNVSKRAKYDSDSRFKGLAEKYPTIDSSNISDFYISYLTSYSEVLGEQFAIMQNSKAISGMFNLQNITLLAELVDHDVTMVDGQVMSQEGILEDVSELRKERFEIDTAKTDLNFFNQLSVGYDSIRQMLRDLSRANIIQVSDEDMRKILKVYVGSFRTKAKDKVPELYQLGLFHKGKIQSESLTLKDPDYFGEDGKLAFCEDIVEMLS